MTIYGGYANKSISGNQSGVIPSTAVSNQFVTGVGSDGVISRAHPSMANVNDYEQGAWTPTDQSGAGLTITVTTAATRYLKIGNLMTLWGAVTYPPTADTNAARLSLPFAIASNKIAIGNMGFSNNGTMVNIENGSQTNFVFFKGDGSSLTNANLSGKIIHFKIQYEV